MKHLSLGLILSLSLAVAQGAGIAPLQESDASGFSSGGASNGVRGWRFVANANVWVQDLGASTNHSAGESYTLTLWDFATQTILAQVGANATGLNVWEWTALPSPVALVSGSQYIISQWSATGSYYFDATSPGSVWQPTGTIEYLDMRYANGATAATFPTLTLTNYQYGVPDIRYTLDAGGQVPEPSTLALVLAGGLLALVARRR